MKGNPLFYTVSMAKLCADQGYFEKSAEILRHLLTVDPDNPVLRERLTEAEARLSVVSEVNVMAEAQSKSLEPMIKKWVELMVEHDLKSKFDKIRRNVKQFQLPSDEV